MTDPAPTMRPMLPGYKLAIAQAAQCQAKSDTNKPLTGEITLGFDVIPSSIARRARPACR
jgi:hypothetical protein